jgi:hypothetical protein
VIEYVGLVLGLQCSTCSLCCARMNFVDESCLEIGIWYSSGKVPCGFIMVTVTISCITNIMEWTGLTCCQICISLNKRGVCKDVIDKGKLYVSIP